MEHYHINWPQTEHWLPNTGIALTVLPLVDPYAGDKPDDKETGNIFENSRKGGLELCYKEGEEDSEPVAIVTYSWDDMEEAYVPVLTDLEGYFYLGISSEEESAPYELVWKTGEGSIKNNFYVRQTGSPFPGDDFLFDFKLTDYPGCRVAPEDEDINFVAVFDHKMLWRANLYISESNDWNDVESHKWNTSDNDWNRVYDLDEFTNNQFDLSRLTKNDNGTGGGKSFRYIPSLIPGREAVIRK